MYKVALHLYGVLIRIWNVLIRIRSPYTRQVISVQARKYSAPALRKEPEKTQAATAECSEKSCTRGCDMGRIWDANMASKAGRCIYQRAALSATNCRHRGPFVRLATPSSPKRRSTTPTCDESPA